MSSNDVSYESTFSNHLRKVDISSIPHKKGMLNTYIVVMGTFRMAIFKSDAPAIAVQNEFEKIGGTFRYHSEEQKKIRKDNPDKWPHMLLAFNLQHKGYLHGNVPNSEAFLNDFKNGKTNAYFLTPPRLWQTTINNNDIGLPKWIKDKADRSKQNTIKEGELTLLRTFTQNTLNSID